jgi:hypothetical protein
MRPSLAREWTPRTFMIDVTHVISERGEQLSASPDAIESALGTRHKPAQLMRYLINSMGFVGIGYGKRVVEIVYDEESVSPVALTGLSYFIADNARRPFAFRTLVDSKKVDLFSSAADALEFVGGLIDKRQTLPRLWRTAIPLERTSFGVRADVAREIATTEIDEPVRLQLFDKLFGGMYSISKWDATTCHFRINHISAKLGQVDQDFVSNCKGRTFHNFVEPEYGRWIADAFAEMVDRDAPLTESIAARVKINNETVNANYTRFLLPFRRGEGQYVLASNDFAQA